MTTVWAFIIIIGVLITIHELGHFIAARSVGIRVERFSIGVPPRFFTITSIDNAWLVSIFFLKKSKAGLKWGPIFKAKIKKPGRIGSNTEYVIALLPLGGYVKMAGMIDESMDINIQHQEDEFMSKPLWAKLWVLSAGVIMNTILAFMVFTFISNYQGSPEISNEPIVSELQEGRPAELAGIKEGDRFTEVNSQKIDTWSDLTEIIHSKPNTEINIKILRGQSELDFNITTTFNLVSSDNGVDTLGAIGIAPEIFFTKISISDALLMGWIRTIDSFVMIIQSLKMLVSGTASVSDLGGPIMIAQLAGQTAEAGLIPFLTFMSLLSVNLAFLNILPIPGLDGGHIFLHLIEAIMRRPLTLKTRVTIQQIGMALLFMLMITVIFQDITRLFH